jgi:uncharacterized protein (TIGR02598 family)
MKIPSPASGFSLIEVVMAVGIAGFALLAIVGLLPVGMKSVQNSTNQAAAANVVNGIANALRNAEKMTPNSFSSSFAGENITYTIAGAQTSISWDTLDLNGNDTNSVSARLKARLVITPPSSANTNGTALISVAWPAQSPNLTWNGSGWNNAQGHLTTGVQFLPPP